MQGTATKPRLRWKLKTVAFESFMRAFHGEKTDAEIAELFEIDANNWSLIKNRHRYFGPHLIARSAQLFPGVMLTEYAEIVSFQTRDCQ